MPDPAEGTDCLREGERATGETVPLPPLLLLLVDSEFNPSGLDQDLASPSARAAIVMDD